MKASFNLSMHRLSAAFWETMFEGVYEQLPAVLPAILANYERCEKFRTESDYDTGSISVAAGVCLYALCRHFQVDRVVEIGTFIGKSTSSMALALARNGPDGAIHTCDKDNGCFEPWQGFGCRVHSYPWKSSTEMLSELSRSPDRADLFFFDGRIQSEDMPLITGLAHPDTIFVFDDFEGTEKGVINVAALRSVLPQHVLFEPCPTEILERYGIQGRSLSALLFNVKNLSITNQ